MRKLIGITLLVVAIVSCSMDGSYSSSFPSSIFVGNNWESLRAIGAVKEDSTRSSAQVYSELIAIDEDGNVQKLKIQDEFGVDVADGMYVNYYKKGNRLDFVNITAKNEPWPFDNMAFTPGDDPFSLLLIKKAVSYSSLMA